MNLGRYLGRRRFKRTGVGCSPVSAPCACRKATTHRAAARGSGSPPSSNEEAASSDAASSEPLPVPPPQEPLPVPLLVNLPAMPTVLDSLGLSDHTLATVGPFLLWTWENRGHLLGPACASGLAQGHSARPPSGSARDPEPRVLHSAARATSIGHALRAKILFFQVVDAHPHPHSSGHGLVQGFLHHREQPLRLGAPGLAPLGPAALLNPCASTREPVGPCLGAAPAPPTLPPSVSSPSPPPPAPLPAYCCH